MNYKRLGKCGLKVSEVCLGTNNFGAQVGEQDAIKIIAKAIDLGINLIDTADIYPWGIKLDRSRYPQGMSEKIIGKAVRGYRDELILTTKVGSDIGQGPNRGGLSRKHILWQIKRSLERLETDFLDIYYLHRYDSETPLEETLRTLNDLVREGIVRYIACSNFAVWQIAKAHEICEIHDLEKFIAVQSPYNLLRRDIEKDLLPYSQHERLGILTYSPLSSGFLTGKYPENGPPPRESRGEYNPQSDVWNAINKKDNDMVLKRIRSVADDVGIPLHKLAIAWILKNPIVTATIIGASKLEHIEENCRIAEINISDETYRKVAEITRS
jgi:aryl-alcohol dehydrogenase-like predicted oxidoreductase